MPVPNSALIGFHSGIIVLNGALVGFLYYPMFVNVLYWTPICKVFALVQVLCFAVVENPVFFNVSLYTIVILILYAVIHMSLICIMLVIVMVLSVLFKWIIDLICIISLDYVLRSLVWLEFLHLCKHFMNCVCKLILL